MIFIAWIAFILSVSWKLKTETTINSDMMVNEITVASVSVTFSTITAASQSCTEDRRQTQTARATFSLCCPSPPGTLVATLLLGHNAIPVQTIARN